MPLPPTDADTPSRMLHVTDTALDQSHRVKAEVTACAEDPGSSNDLAKVEIADGATTLPAAQALQELLALRGIDLPVVFISGRAAALERGRPSGKKPLILVAEDNEINRKVLTKQLALLGYQGEMVNDGMEALTHWRRGGYALLLTDLHMPAMDGYTLAAAVRAEEAGGPRLPIIALTANALRDEELRCRQAGMDGYLTKPVRLAQLKAAIDVWLRPAPPRPSAATPDAPERTSPPVDLGVLVDLIGDDPQVLQEVLEAFRASTAHSALELARAQAGHEIQSPADIAHKLKSAARAIGAARLGQICADIEKVATAAPRSVALGPLMSDFGRELQAVHHFLDTR